MYPLKQSTAITVPFYLHDANGDPVPSKVDANFTKRISKNGAAFGAMTVTITEMENGWYSATVSSAHTDTLGILSITFQVAGAKQVNLQFRVFSATFDDAVTIQQVVNGVWDEPRGSHTTAGTFGQGVASVQGNLTGSVASIASGGIVAASFAAGAIDAAALATDCIGSNELSTAAAQKIADAYLDRADAIETGLTPRQCLRLVVASTAGKVSGADTTTVVIRNAVQDSKPRITATVDVNGNRTAITYDVS
jgi:hypothetical protein